MLLYPLQTVCGKDICGYRKWAGLSKPFLLVPSVFTIFACFLLLLSSLAIDAVSIETIQRRVYSNSRNGVPPVAQWYGTIAPHTWRRVSVLVVFVVFCEHMYSFAGLIRPTPPPTFSDTAFTDRHSHSTNIPAQSSLGADILIYWIIKIVRTCDPGWSRTIDFLCAR